MSDDRECDADGFGPRDIQSLLPKTVSRETFDRLTLYVAELRRWNKTHNLIGPVEFDRIWRRHILDSLQAFHAQPHAKSWVDFGSGCGLPGLVIGICLTETGGGQCTLIEANAKKAAFLRTVSQKLDLSVTVLAQRIEAVSAFPADIVTARALADLNTLLSYAEPWLARGAQCLFLKGKDVEEERINASRHWRFNDTLTSSVSDSEGMLVHITEASRVK